MAKKKKNPKKTSAKYKCYEIAGSELKRTRKSCPKCGVGIFMAKHKNRHTCGKCSYTEFEKK